MGRSRSSLRTIGLREKFRQAKTLWRLRNVNEDRRAIIAWLVDEIDGYRETFERLTGRSFADARIFEIGFGAQPFRLIALNSMGFHARGIDIDLPMLRFSPARLLRIARTNGLERALKTAVRNLFFDRNELKWLRQALEHQGYRLKVDESCFEIGDVAKADLGEPVDVVISEHVFEHIPRADMDRVLAKICRLLSPGGLALITPDIFTGIAGGHLPEWYWDEEGDERLREAEPWEHLRKKRFRANTYLNEFTRREYREHFARWFEIVEERVLAPDLGRHRLTPQIREELSEWDDDELFSNSVQFVLRPRQVATGGKAR